MVCFRKIIDRAGNCQNRLCTLVLHKDYYVNFHVELVKNIFSIRHRVFAFVAIRKSVTLNLNLFQIILTRFAQ